MANCDNRWEKPVPIIGSGATEKAAADDFEDQLKTELKSAREKLKCENKDCTRESGLGDEEGEGKEKKQCLFTYVLNGDDKPKESEREVFVWYDDDFHSIKFKWWERSCTLKYGCWCVPVGPKDSKK